MRTDGTHFTKVHNRTMAMEIFGHEFWSMDGKTVWYDLQTPRGEVFWQAGYNVESGERIWYGLQRNEWSIHDEKQVAHAPNGKWIYLFRPWHRRQEFCERRRVACGAIGKHVEASISLTPDQKWVVFR
jgi:oligogalacturonide lyase